MSSSTSSFRRPILVALVVLAIVGLFEVFTRKVLFNSSKDLRRFSTYPNRALTFSRSQRPLVALVGNSITERGIDPDELHAELNASVTAFTADSSHLTTWFWMVNAELWRQHIAPDLIVLTFNADSLEDGAKIEIGRLAQFFTTPSDWPELFSTHRFSAEERAEVVVSWLWATYAVRERVKERVFKLVPGYTRYMTFQNDVSIALEHAGARNPPPPSFTLLERFLDRAHSFGTHVVIVAFPTKDAYEVDARIPTLIASHEADFIDLRALPELDQSKHYDDNLHLNAAGRAIYTKRLATELRRLRLVQ